MWIIVKPPPNFAPFRFHIQHRASVRELAFSPDMKLLVTASFRNLLVWSLDTGKLVCTLERHEEFIRQCWFQPLPPTIQNGKKRGRHKSYLVTCGEDKKCIIWDVEHRVSVASFTAHCPLENVVVADDLSSIVFFPHNVAYIGILKPNSMLGRVLRQEDSNEVPDNVQTAQAYALTFSSTKITNETSKACVIL